MTPIQRVTKHIGSYEVTAGVRIPVPTNLDKISFTLVAVCESSEPERWHGEVSFAGQLLIATPTVDDHAVAGRDAENALKARVVEVFSG